MSDEPSDAQKLILEALSGAIAKSFVGVGGFVIDRQRVARIDGRVDLRAVAAEVDKALGGLTREWSARMVGDGEVTAVSEGTARYCARQHPKTWDTVSRFASGWTVTE